MTNTVLTTDPTTLNAADMIAYYRTLRDEVSRMEEEHERQVGVIKAEMQRINERLLAICAEQGVDSLKTPFGTASRTIKKRFWTSDWDALYRFIKENDAPYLLQQRIHMGNMEQFLEEHPDKLPEGLQLDKEYTITVRKPTNR